MTSVVGPKAETKPLQGSLGFPAADASSRVPSDTFVMTSPWPGSCPYLAASAVYAGTTSLAGRFSMLCALEVRVKLSGTPGAVAAVAAFLAWAAAAAERSRAWRSAAAEIGTDGVSVGLTVQLGSAKVTSGLARSLATAAATDVLVTCSTRASG